MRSCGKSSLLESRFGFKVKNGFEAGFSKMFWMRGPIVQ